MVVNHLRMRTQKQDEEPELDLETASFRGLGLLVAPSSLFTPENVQRVDLSSNQLTRFPGARVARELPCLEVLLLHGNLLHVLEDVLALSASPRLRELDVRDNPLRLRHHRLYLLEALLFQEPGVNEELLLLLSKDESFKRFGENDAVPSRAMHYRSQLPRRRGFPMLLMLNGAWITDLETRQVEGEHGKPVEYFQPSSRSKTSLRNEARITAIPLPRVLTRFQIDTESGQEVQDDTNTANPLNEDEEDDHELLQRLFRPNVQATSSGNTEERVTGSSEGAQEDAFESWNYPISTFDDLNSEDRQYVRSKSKHTGGTLERDDHFFESSTFVDCVAQCERSRRLTIRAVDVLTGSQVSSRGSKNQLLSPSTASQSTPALPISEAAATLTDNLTAKFSQRQALKNFEVRAVGDYFLDDHLAQKMKANQLLRAQGSSESRLTVEASLEASMSRVKLRNAVDLANSLADFKEQKRMLQALIDADEKVIEEERVWEEQKAHRQRLRLINARQYSKSRSKREATRATVAEVQESPWQERNWKAKTAQLEQKEKEAVAVAEPGKKKEQRSLPAKPKAVAFAAGSSRSLAEELAAPMRVVDQFRRIETVEKAAQDPLRAVNSHDLLVRCSEIRQNKDKHVRALAQHRDRFLDDEAEWEQMRQDPINVVRRHLRRKLYQDVQQVQIGSAEYFYSPLFE
ncbi:hypothetical protein BBJ28_00001532 [Nothophytophthora sp. Chile5]|nr:hypothetical protein BBJ28_00001532 [Nothophytophthora sp. Chile5]